MPSKDDIVTDCCDSTSTVLPTKCLSESSVDSAVTTDAIDGKIKPAGLPCHLWNDGLFAKLRKVLSTPSDFVNEGWSFDDLREGTGKGGGKMLFIDSSYIVKELSNDDHLTLLDIAESYVNHVLEGNSLLCFILLHFTEPCSGRRYCVMRNEVGAGPFSALYDLKGCADDKALVFNGKKIKPVHKRIWKVHLWCGRCCWSMDRHAFYYGKLAAAEVEFYVSDTKRLEIHEQVQRDTDWLQSQGLMDYSLLVALSAPPAGEPLTFGEDVEDGRLSLTIIDFLQRWTLQKRVANGAKYCENNKATVPPEVYGRRFRLHFEDRFTSASAVAPVPVQMGRTSVPSDHPG